MRVVAAGALALLALAAAPPPAVNDNAGARVFAQCVACHAIEPGRNTPAGPTLHGVVGRPVAAQPGFNYSPALRRFAASNPRWTPELLDRFLADPERVVPGTEMGLIGLRDPAQRRAVIAFLDGSRRHN
ncbi:MAG TPA: c-type cytochrome [Allosphingosinicella sp.]|jgi:cytochrome c